MNNKKSNKSINEDRRGEYNFEPKIPNDQDDRRNGYDRRGSDAIGGRRRTDVAEEEFEEYEKIMKTDEGKLIKEKLEQNRKVINLNDEAKKIEIKRTINIYKLNIKRVTTILTLLILTGLLIAALNYVIGKRVEAKKNNLQSIYESKKELNKTINQVPQKDIIDSVQKRLDEKTNNNNK